MRVGDFENSHLSGDVFVSSRSKGFVPVCKLDQVSFSTNSGSKFLNAGLPNESSGLLRSVQLSPSRRMRADSSGGVRKSLVNRGRRCFTV